MDARSMIVSKGAAMDEPSRLDLLDIGTRWQHYSELRELFALGIEILKNLPVKSSIDEHRRVKLEHAVEMIDGRLSLLSDYVHETTFGSRLRSSIEHDVDALYKQFKREREANDQDEHGAGASPNPIT
jgi:hypothetical protein